MAKTLGAAIIIAAALLGAAHVAANLHQIRIIHDGNVVVVNTVTGVVQRCSFKSNSCADMRRNPFEKFGFNPPAPSSKQ